MNGNFTLTADGKEIKLRLCQFSLKRFCELEGGDNGPISLADMYVRFQSMTHNSIVNLLRAAAEYFPTKEGRDVSFSDMEICDWIDEAGGITSFAPTLVDYLSEVINPPAALKDEAKKKVKAPRLSTGTM